MLLSLDVKEILYTRYANIFRNRTKPVIINEVPRQL